MLRLSRLTDYAVAALVRLGRAEGVETSPGIAAAIGLPEPTVAKVLKALANQGLVREPVPLPGRRPLGPGERRDPRRTDRDYLGRHGSRRRAARFPRSGRNLCSR